MGRTKSLYEGDKGPAPTAQSIASEASRLMRAAPLLQRVAEIDERFLAIERERDPGGPLPHPEIADRLVARVHERVRAFVESDPDRRDLAAMDAYSLVKLLGVTGGDPTAGTNALLAVLLFALAGDELDAKIRKAVCALPYRAGRPAAERERVERELTAEQARLEAEREKLVDEASALGVEVRHTQAVRERRNVESVRRRERDNADPMPDNPAGPILVWKEGPGCQLSSPAGKLQADPNSPM